MSTIRKRVIPVLLLSNGGLVKSVKFKNNIYVGDPINAVKLFNDKEVDEIIILDIQASKKGNNPDFTTISEITGEAFMPLAYGGGISSIEHAEKLFYNGVEKIIINHHLTDKNGFKLINQITERYGNQSVIVSIDVKDGLFGSKKVYSHVKQKVLNFSPIEYAKKCEDSGAGEIFLNSIRRDGTYLGYDLDLISQVSDSVDIPVIVCGGASEQADFYKAEEAGASAMAAGSMFVFQRPNQAVLISYI